MMRIMMMGSKNGGKVSNVKLNLDVHIDEVVYQKIMHWVNKAGNYEVSGLGNVVYDKETKCLRVTEAWLLEQENTGSTTDIEDNAVGKLMFEHHKSGIEGDLRFWWHSHAGMSVFWSGTDKDTIKELGEGGWFLSTVFNNKAEMKSCVYMTDPMEIFADDLTTLVMSNIPNDDVKEALGAIGLRPVPGKLNELRWMLEQDVEYMEPDWDAEYDDKVSKKVHTPTPYTGSNYNGHYHGNYSSQQSWQNGKTTNTSADSKKEPFPDYDPKKNEKKGPDSFGWFCDGTPLDFNDSENLFVQSMLGEIENYRQEFMDAEIIDIYERELPNIREVLDYLQEQEDEREANEA